MAQHPAQTNLQLYNQLAALSWSQDDLRRARLAYDFADRMFVGARRTSGKPFISHLVGTASVAADVDGRPEVVLAALLHSVYTDGTASLSSRAPSRATIRSIAGAPAEAIVYRYGTTAWGPDAFADAVANVDSYDAARRDVLMLRLVNEVDEHADLGTRYADKGAFLRDGDDALAPMAELAERLDRPQLAETFRRLLEEERGVTVPAVLRSSTQLPSVPVPGSPAWRLATSARAAAARARQALASVPAARTAVHKLRALKPSARSLAGDR